MEFSFFTTDNKSGYKTKEKWFSSKYPDEYISILNYINDLKIEMSFKEKIFFYYNGLKDRPRCLSCGKELIFRERLDKGYGEFCTLQCFNSDKNQMIERQKKTFNEKYGIDFYTEHPDFLEKQRKTKKEKYGDEKYNNVEKMKITKFMKYGDESFNNIEKGKITMITKYGVDNYSKSNTYKNKLNEEYKKTYPKLNFKDVNKNFLKIKCDTCGETYQITKQLVYERSKRNYVVCVNCNPIGQSNRSGNEIELENFIKTLNIPFETSNRKILNGSEIDLYFPNENIGIELNGVYWHNELFVETNYHLNKTIKSNDKDIELIHIFEDEWLYKTNIVKSIIKNRFNLNEKTIYARKCIIREINNDESKKFLNDNHIQGNVNSKVRVGLFFGNEMVSLMTFSKGRIIMGGKSDEWELNRFCNLIDLNVVGGASRLLKYFKEKYKPLKLISYSDIRLFNGNLYEKLGFIRKSQSKPNYWYVINGIRYHRFNFNKSKLIKEGFEKTKTEKEIMFDRKIYRIYDCGNIRWELNEKTT